jgi:hypothetical protein
VPRAALREKFVVHVVKGFEEFFEEVQHEKGLGR